MRIHHILLTLMFCLTGCSSIQDSPSFEMSQIVRSPKKTTEKVPTCFFLINQNCRILQSDELTKKIVTTLKTLSNFQIDFCEVNGVQATTVLNELKKRMQEVNLESFFPALKDVKNSEIYFIVSDASVLLILGVIASCNGDDLLINDDGTLLVSPKEDEFHHGFTLQNSSKKYFVFRKEKVQKVKRELEFQASVQGIIVGRNIAPIGFKGSPKYYLSKLKEFIFQYYSPVIAVENDPYVKLLIMMQEGNDWNSIFSFDSLGNKTRHIALHEYKKYFGEVNPIGKSFKFTIESIEDGDGAISYRLKKISFLK